jgi:OmpA-OmpF porin, OOP family
VRRAAAALGVLGFLLAGTDRAAADEIADLGTPTPQMISSSVTVFAIGGVTRFVVDGSVTRLQSERTGAGRTKVTVSSDVLFAFGSATPAPDAGATVARLLARAPRGVVVGVDGYTDSVGTEQANFALSTRRAAAIAAVLHAARPDVRVTSAGHGEADPVAPNGSPGADNPAGRALNRRVTLSFRG